MSHQATNRGVRCSSSHSWLKGRETCELGHSSPAALTIGEDEVDQLPVLLCCPGPLLQPHLITAWLPPHASTSHLLPLFCFNTTARVRGTQQWWYSMAKPPASPSFIAPSLNLAPYFAVQVEGTRVNCGWTIASSHVGTWFSDSALPSAIACLVCKGPRMRLKGCRYITISPQEMVKIFFKKSGRIHAIFTW